MEVRVVGTFTPAGAGNTANELSDNDIESSRLISKSDIFGNDSKSRTSRKRKRSPFYTLHSSQPDQDSNRTEEELYITEDSVTWSINGKTHKTFSFQQDEQKVNTALFAYFEIATERSETNETPDPPDGIDSDAFGVFHVARLRADQDRKQKRTQHARRRALCIFLRDIAKIYVEDGPSYMLNLPFPIQRAWALDLGVLLQRKSDDDELHPSTKASRRFSNIIGSPEPILGNMLDLDIKGDTLPLIFSLSNPLDDIAPVSSTSVLRVTKADGRKNVVVSSDRHHISDLSEDTIYVSPHDDMRIIVTFNRATDLCSVWRYETLAEDDWPPELGAKRRRSSSSRRRSSLPNANTGRMSLGEGDINVNTMLVGGDIKSRAYIHLLTQFPMQQSEDVTCFIVRRNKYLTILCIMDKRAKTLFAYNVDSTDSEAFMVSIAFTMPALAAVPLAGTEVHRQSILFLSLDFQLQLWLGPSHVLVCTMPKNFQSSLYVSSSSKRSRDHVVQHASEDVGLVSTLRSPSRASRVTDLSHAVGHQFNISLSDGVVARIALDLRPNSDLVRDCLKAMAYAMPADYHQDLESRYLMFRHSSSARQLPHHACKSDWEAFIVTLMSYAIGDAAKSLPTDMYESKNSNTVGPATDVDWDFLLCSSYSNSYRKPVGTPDREYEHAAGTSLLTYWQKACVLSTLPMHSITGSNALEYLPSIFYALHLVAEDLSLYLRQATEHTSLLLLLTQLSGWLKWNVFTDYYTRLCPTLILQQYVGVPSSQRFPDAPAIPSIFRHCSALLGRGQATAFPTLAAVPILFNIGDISVTHDDMTNTQAVCEIYAALVSHSDPGKAAETTLLSMESHKWTRQQVEDLPMGLALPLLEVLATCRTNPKGDWPPEAYHLIDREDIALQITSSLQSSKTQPSGFQMPTSDMIEVTALRFQNDLRFVQVAELLQYNSPTPVKIAQEGDVGEQELTAHQQSVILALATRTIALPLGRAAIIHSTTQPVSTKRFEMSGIDTSARILPYSTVKQLESEHVPENFLEWPEFHDGVCAGLSIASDSQIVDNSWITFNRPDELNNSHGGFLLGLGLAGRLKALVTWHAFTYLTLKHDLTSIGLLLGLAASHVGTSDPTITKVLSVHNTALLPSGSSELNLSPLTQIASLYGVGLLYLGSQNRRMTEILLVQIGTVSNTSGGSTSKTAESYSFAAGIALGMVVLGKGDEADGLLDLNLSDALRRYIGGSRFDLDPMARSDITSPGATIALGLIYLKTNNAGIAAKIEIPATNHALANVRPDFLLYRTLSRNLIMWDRIGKDSEWIINQLPFFVSNKMRNMESDDVQAIRMAYTNIVAGSCFAMALKYAGSCDDKVCQTLLGYLDTFAAAAGMAATTFEDKIARTSVRAGVDLLALCVATVMAGSGDLNVLRRLLKLHSRVSHDVTYGSHMATNIALGILFLGAGRCTLSTSNMAIAAMISAYYPRFPKSSDDNRAHLQAVRHFWALAVEPRCLVTRDFESKEACNIPLTIEVLEEQHTDHGEAVTRIVSRKVESPFMMPEFSHIVSIKVDSPRYWPLVLDIARNPLHAQSLLRTRTIYVRRKTGHLPYVSDKRGFSSIFSRPFPGDPTAAILGHAPAVQLDAETDLVEAFSADTQFSMFADAFCISMADKEPAWASYAMCILYEAFTKEKSEMINNMMEVFATLQTEDLSALTRLSKDVKLAKTYYARSHELRGTLITRRFSMDFIDVVQRRLDAIGWRLLEEFGDLLARYLQMGQLFSAPIDSRQVAEKGSNMDVTAEFSSRQAEVLVFLLNHFEIPEWAVLEVIKAHRGNNVLEAALLSLDFKDSTIDIINSHMQMNLNHV